VSRIPSGAAAMRAPHRRSPTGEPDFAEFVREVSPRLMRTAYLLGGSQCVAEDLVQEALERACRPWRRIAATEAPEAYVRRIVVSLANDRWRQLGRARESDRPEVPGRPDPQDGYGRLDLRDQLAAMLETLPIRMRTVIVLRYFHGMDDARIADALGTTAGAVRSQLSRGVARLRGSATGEPSHDEPSGDAPSRPPDPAPEPERIVSGPNALSEFEGFDAELAAALAELGRQVRPHEFDSHTILRRTARRRYSRVLAASAAGIAVVVGASAFAALAGAPAATPASALAASTQTATGTDPLVVPGYFRTSPNGGAANGFTRLGGTTRVSVDDTGQPYDETLSVATDWTLHGTDLSARVQWFGNTRQSKPGYDPGSAVGTLDGHDVYYNAHLADLTFWTGARGYATAVVFTDSTGRPDRSATGSELLSVARSLVTTPAEVPLPIRIIDLDSAKVTMAKMGWLASESTEPWYACFTLEIDGRSYDVSVVPGQPAALEATGNGAGTTSGEVSASKTVNGLGITVSTSSGNGGSGRGGSDNGGSASAPTVAQVLSHIVSLGVSPSGWTTNVLVK
jgi:RNA polymerase sigma-70 factor (sigma-E family)